jgi:hypothetical protein
MLARTLLSPVMFNCVLLKIGVVRKCSNYSLSTRHAGKITTLIFFPVNSSTWAREKWKNMEALPPIANKAGRVRSDAMFALHCYQQEYYVPWCSLVRAHFVFQHQEASSTHSSIMSSKLFANKQNATEYFLHCGCV